MTMKQLIRRLVTISAMSTVLILSGCVTGGSGAYNDTPSYNYGVYGGYGYPHARYGYGHCCYGSPGRPHRR